MPMSWKMKKLGEVCNFEGGSQPPKTYFSDVETEDSIRLIQIRDYKSDNHIVYIPRNKAKRFCDENDIMIGRYGPPVFQILRGLKGAYNVALMKAIPNENIISKEYLFLFLKYSKIQEYIINLSQRAAGQTGVNKEALEAYLIPIPPISHQKRIVAILDEVCAVTDKAKENSEKNLQNARELFESYLQSVFNNPSDGWERVRIEDVCESIMDCINKTAPTIEEPTPYKMIRTTNVRDGKLNLDKVKFVTQDVFQNWTRRQVPMIGDVILTREAPLGEVGMINTDDKVFLGQRLVSYRVDASKLNNRFLLYAFQSADVQRQIQALASGSTVQHMRVPDSKTLKLYLPSLPEQKRIVAKLDAMLEETNKLRAIYDQKLVDLEELKKSILEKAFKGELIGG